jgi:poly(3-hydroxybutyrate) depolymerase
MSIMLLLLLLSGIPLQPVELSLNREQAQTEREKIIREQSAQLRKERGDEWQKQQIVHNNLTMKFTHKTFGEKPAKGRLLYISMHGGGGTTSKVNDGQWRNQQGLYQPAEGVYIAPRAPNDAWNMWFQPHMDVFFALLIEDAVLFADVDVNRVYLMGYSAGGDGVFRLATRLADRWAAATMMAGHPGDVAADNLRNLPFALYMGGKDAAYDRNKHAAEWKVKLAELHKNDPTGYIHDVVIYPEYGHWMQRKDAVALPWMAKYERNTAPKKVVWHQPHAGSLYWLAEAVVENGKERQARVKASITGQTVQLTSEHVEKITIRLRDDLLNLDQPIIVKSGDKVIFEGKVARTRACLEKTWKARLDAGLVFDGEVTVGLK